MLLVKKEKEPACDKEVEEQNKPGSQLLNGSACFPKKAIAIKLGLQDKPGKHDLAEAMKTL